MKNILRGSVFGAVVFLMLATSAQTFAQQVRSRSLAPAFDFTAMQMPVEIISIKLNGQEVQPGEKIAADDDWLLGLSFRLKNISDKPIAFIDIGLRFPRPNGFVVYSLNYGVDFSRGEHRREGSPRAIEPGATFDLTLTKEKYASFQCILDVGGASRSFDSVPYHIARICFDGEPDLIWEGGNLKRRDENEFTKFNIVERYTLPGTPK